VARISTRFSEWQVADIYPTGDSVVMARTTRRGMQFSPFELDLLDLGPSNGNIDIFRAKVSLAPVIRAAIVAADQRAATLDEGADGDDDWEDEDPVLSRAPTPLSRPITPLSRPETPSSIATSRSSSPLSDAPPSPVLPADSRPGHKRRAAQGKKARRKRARVSKAQENRFGPIPQLKHCQEHREHPPHHAAFQVADLPSGTWTGPHPAKKARVTQPQVHTRDELLAAGVELVQWEGQCVHSFVLPALDGLRKSLTAIPS
jgi:hypothetical protein